MDLDPIFGDACLTMEAVPKAHADILNNYRFVQLLERTGRLTSLTNSGRFALLLGMGSHTSKRQSAYE